MRKYTLRLCVRMTGRSIYFDTAPFIYLVEGHPVFAAPVAELLSEGAAVGTTFYTSVLAVMEFSVRPYQMNRPDILQELAALLQQLAFTIQPITLPIAQQAARLRATYPFLKSLDALHLAAAQEMGCETFLTNDKQLAQVKTLSIQLLTDMI